MYPGRIIDERCQQAVSEETEVFFNLVLAIIYARIQVRENPYSGIHFLCSVP